jgi:lipopolysaccharide export system permease protein
MPIVWRFLLGHYTKIFILSLISFIAILLVNRLDEIARFISLGAPFYLVVRFTINQILYILPIAIPIASLLAATLLFQYLSRTHELTAFRSAGMGLRNITAPILIAGLFLSLLNFYIVSELSTRSHLSCRKMVSDLKSVNPLHVLQNKQLLRLKDAYVHMGALYSGEVAHDVIIAVNNKNTDRLNIVSAKTLRLSDKNLTGNNFSFISTHTSNTSDYYDHLFIENHALITTPLKEFSHLLKASNWKINNDHLRLPLLRSKISSLKNKLAANNAEDINSAESLSLRKEISRCYSEISRRFSSAISAFTFTLMGSAFGISISRGSSKRGTFTVIALAATFLISFFVAKNYDSIFSLSTLLYFAPHALITASSIWILKRITKGIE